MISIIDGEICLMECLVISDKKLKIMLTAVDMKNYCLSCEEIESCGGTDFCTKKAFRHILSDAEKMCGFEAVADRFLCQIFPSKDGSCELFITKIDIDSLLATYKNESNENTEHLPLSPSKPKRRRAERYIFVYKEFSHLMKVCQSMKKCNFDGESLAYTNGKKYFLLFNDINYLEMPLRGGMRITSFSIAGEYGEQIECDRSGVLISYIEEHCIPIATTDAVGTLGKNS